jgi:hypothetical protein
LAGRPGGKRPPAEEVLIDERIILNLIVKIWCKIMDWIQLAHVRIQ